MKTYKLFLIGAAALAACGCAAFTSGDIRVDKATAQAMFDDHTLTPFSDVQLAWKNYPYHAPSDSIGEGTISPVTGKFRTPAVKAVPVDPDDQAALLIRARKIFSEAGLYDKQKGRGTLRLELTSVNRWTYGELLSSYLVETSFVFIIPSSLRTGYLLTASFQTSTGTARVETLGTNKTVFHLLMAPLYLFFPPSSGEKGLLTQMLWRTATDVYDATSRAAKAAKEKAAAAPVPVTTPAAVPAPAPPAAAQATPALQSAAVQTSTVPSPAVPPTISEPVPMTMQTAPAPAPAAISTAPAPSPAAVQPVPAPVVTQPVPAPAPVITPPAPATPPPTAPPPADTPKPAKAPSPNSADQTPDD